MAAHLVQKYTTATPVLTDSQPVTTTLDAVETLKAVQGIITTYLANGAVDIPTPEPSPLGRVGDQPEDGEHEEVVGAEEEGAVGDAADGLVGGRANGEGVEGKGTNGVVVDGVREVGGEKGIKVNDAGSTPLVQATDEVEEDRESSDEKTNTMPDLPKMEPPIFPPNESTHANGPSLNTRPPPTTPGPDQDKLHSLLDQITRNLPHISTDDGARIKATTAALELAAVVRPPGDIVMGWFANMSVVSAVRLFIHWGAFEQIPLGKGERITVVELAGRIGADEPLVGTSPLFHHPLSISN